MLVNPKFIRPHPMNTLNMIFTGLSAMTGGPARPERIEDGLYRLGHWNFNHFLGPGWSEYPELEEIYVYGVCDSPNQFMKKYGRILQKSLKKYVVCFAKMEKSHQPADGGWRWHKWGPYIGEQKPQCEYLYDEPEIEEVYTYHIYEEIKQGGFNDYHRI